MIKYTNANNEELPAVICAVIEFEKQRLSDSDKRPTLRQAFFWNRSTIFGPIADDNYSKWEKINNGDYDCFYELFPTVENSHGIDLPEYIQVEIVEERLRQGVYNIHVFQTIYTEHYCYKKTKFDWAKSIKGYDYWNSIYWKEDFPKTETPKPTSSKNPIGLRPKANHQKQVDNDRYIEVCEAIKRYYDAGLKINVEWIEEYNELVEKLDIVKWKTN